MNVMLPEVSMRRMMLLASLHEFPVLFASTLEFAFGAAAGAHLAGQGQDAVHVHGFLLVGHHAVAAHGRQGALHSGHARNEDARQPGHALAQPAHQGHAVRVRQGARPRWPGPGTRPRHASRACAPVPAWTTRNPASSNTRSMTSRCSARSSTISMQYFSSIPDSRIPSRTGKLD